MRVLLSTCGSSETSNQWRDSQCSRQYSVQVQVCAPPDFAELLALVGVPLAPIGVWR